MTLALGSISSNQAKIKEKNPQAIKQIFDYCNTHPDAKIRYKQINMVLRIHSNGY